MSNNITDFIKPAQSRKSFTPALRTLSPRRLSKQAASADPVLRKDLRSIAAILRARRASGTKSHDAFQRDVLEPVFGAPFDGTYGIIVGDKNPRVAFISHHDTVERVSGEVGLYIGDDLVIGIDPKDTVSAALGADDGAGIWLMLEMIAAGVPGLYLIFDEEESGLIGSSRFARSREAADLLTGVEFALAFDRHDRDGNQVITHMMGGRTMSDTAAAQLVAALGMGYRASNDGSITDSYSLDGVGDVREITNITVAYQGHHTRNETLDFAALRTLRDKLVQIDWSVLSAHRVALDDDFARPKAKAASIYRQPTYDTDADAAVDREILIDLIRDYPNRVADLLLDLGMDSSYVAEALDVHHLPLGWRF